MSENPMRALRVEKVTVNIGVGEAGEKLVKAQKVLEMVTNQKSVQTISKTVNRDLGIRVGMPLGRASSGRPSASGRTRSMSTPSTRRVTCPSVSPTTPTSKV